MFGWPHHPRALVPAPSPFSLIYTGWLLLRTHDKRPGSAIYSVQATAKVTQFFLRRHTNRSRTAFGQRLLHKSMALRAGTCPQERSAIGTIRLQIRSRSATGLSDLSRHSYPGSWEALHLAQYVQRMLSCAGRAMQYAAPFMRRISSRLRPRWLFKLQDTQH
jgi:hypothetical protein